MKIRLFCRKLVIAVLVCSFLPMPARAADNDLSTFPTLYLLLLAIIKSPPDPPDPPDPTEPPDPSPEWWQPRPGTSWQWQLEGEIDTSIEAAMYDIDYETPEQVIDTLHAQGRIVICYISMGSWESYRSDAGQYPEQALGQALEGWPDERWVDVRALDVLGPILTARMDVAAAKGCDGIEPDNIDGYTNETGFPLTADDQLAFNRWLADRAHERGLSIGLKNDVEQAQELEPYFDWALNEQCFQYRECELLLPFVNADKAVFGVEYAGDTASFCPQANGYNFDWLKKNEELDAWRLACR